MRRKPPGSRVQFVALPSRRTHLQIASDQFRPSPWTPPAIGWQNHDHDLFPLRLPRLKANSRTCFHARIDRYRTMQGPGIPGNLIGRAIYGVAASGYAQQDVAPSWYDPWAAPQVLVAHPAQAPSGGSFLATTAGFSPASNGGEGSGPSSAGREASCEENEPRSQRSQRCLQTQ